MALPYPEIGPNVFPPVGPFEVLGMTLGPFALRWYALGYVAGILIGWRYAVGLVRNAALWPRRGPPATAVQIDDFILWLTLGIIIGGRLGHVLFYTPSIILADPMQVLRVWEGGMSFHGGALGVLAATLWFAWANKVDLFRLGDVVTAAAPFGIFFVRIANFLNDELWGRPTSVPWAVVFPNGGVLPRHPSQIYEALLEGVVMFILLRWATHRAGLLNRRGVVAGMFMIAYALFRSFVENFREPDAYLPDYPFGLTMGMMLSAPLLIGGAWLVWRGLREPLPAAGSVGPAAAADAAPSR